MSDLKQAMGGRGSQSTRHRCCSPGESKAGTGAVNLMLFALTLSLGCASAWRNIYGGGPDKIFDPLSKDLLGDIEPRLSTAQ